MIASFLIREGNLPLFISNMCVFPLHPGSWSLAATSLLVHFDLEFGKGYMHIVCTSLGTVSCKMYPLTVAVCTPVTRCFA